ncbi:hypothetical protein PVAND_008410 [Polypedilum vanderplanki]|uniref:Paramyosin n=1 Tax=Polypedilum vanderplanki TaxID=319348 RepID=A0A9J6CAY9_POLVA|nr:hypothetical protein PVAND_008410 [Polypedilum vanderplanki]
MANIWIHVTPTDLHRAKTEYKPGHPHSKIYDYTYGYSMNYYQPMIDYLDRRDSLSVHDDEKIQLPHLPWTNERYIQEYDPKNPLMLYNDKELKRIAVKSQTGALKNINNFDVKRSYFSAIPTADATKLLRKLPKTSALEAVYKKDVGQLIEDIKNLEMETYYRYKEGERKMIQEERENFPLELKRAIKGKSANQIRNILLADSMRKIRESSENDAKVLRECYATTRTRRAARSLSESRPNKHACECSPEPNPCQKVSYSLENVKKELNSFTHKTEEFLSDTRYRLHLINRTLVESEDFLNDRKLERKRQK